MKDYLEFKKTGTDTQFMLLQVTGASACIQATSRIYVTSQMLSDLHQEVKAFLCEQDLEGYWENDVPGIGGPPCVTLRFLPRQGSSQVLLETYMELNDGGDFGSHNCRFYIHTDRSHMEKFLHDLGDFMTPTDGESIRISGV